MRLGAVALTMALRSPGATVHAVDVNERALDLTRRNADAAGVRVSAALPDDVPDDLRFAALWSNPPIRVGKPALHEPAAALAAAPRRGRQRLPGRAEEPGVGQPAALARRAGCPTTTSPGSRATGVPGAARRGALARRGDRTPVGVHDQRRAAAAPHRLGGRLEPVAPQQPDAGRGADLGVQARGRAPARSGPRRSRRRRSAARPPWWRRCATTTAAQRWRRPAAGRGRGAR
nr:methyltransferase [Angustibacter aerolatus]